LFELNSRIEVTKERIALTKYLSESGVCAASGLLLMALLFLPAGMQAADLAREIQDSLVAPCCWSQPVSQHDSEIAHQIRHEVSEMVSAGKSRDEILNFYVAAYGERILVAPRATGFNLLAYILPWVALIAGVWFVVALLKKMRSPASSPVAAAAPDSRYSSLVEKEIKDLDD